LIFADLGADVIKVEQPGRGDYMRWIEPYSDEYGAMFSATCRNKRSVTLDLRADADREALLALADEADVVVESFRPGVADRLGVGYTELSERNRRVVYCSISGYGQTGPRAQRPGHDLNYLAVAGILDMTGPAGDVPVAPGVQMADVWGGGVSAAFAVAMALYERERTGAGRYLDAAMFDGVTAGLVNHAPKWLVGGERFQRGHEPLTGRHPNYDVYPAADGHMAVANYEPQFWSALCMAIDRPQLLTEAESTGASAVAARETLADVMRKRTRDEWCQLLAGTDTCVEPVSTLEEALDSDDFAARQLLVDVDIEGRRERQLATPFTRYGDGDHVRAPRLGEHNETIVAGPDRPSWNKNGAAD
jgi:crotonobetainyl-CoA:carnitine CoA-transferase CaiB-like acyl-CoA transferase